MRHSWISVLVPSLCAWISFTLVFAVSNASKEDYKYRHNLALSIIRDLDVLNLNDQKLTVSGNPPAAPTTRSLINVFPFIRKLVHKGYEMDFLFINGSREGNYAPKLYGNQVVEMEKQMPLHVTPHYKFYKFNDALVVRFPDSMCKN